MGFYLGENYIKGEKLQFIQSYEYTHIKSFRKYIANFEAKFPKIR